MARRPGASALSIAGAGRLAVIGGRLEDSNAAIYAEMHRLSGGRILIFPTASSVPVEVGEESVAAFRAHGFQAEVAPLYGPAAAQHAHDPALTDRIASIGSVYFTGGDQSKIVEALAPGGVGTPVLAAIRQILQAGGLLAGSSAGAAMMSQPMLLGGTSLEAVVHGVTEDPDTAGLLVGRGLGFFPFGMVDQHFIKRGRLARLVVAMNAAGIRRGFGIDENTALLVEGATGRVCGEYGMMLIDLGGARIDAQERSYQDIRVSYLDDGDSVDLHRFRSLPGAAKRRVRLREIAYRAPVRSRRNAFGAYTLYDLMARLVLGDPSVYSADRADAFDAKSGFNVTVEMERVRGRSRALIATPQTGLRMTGIDFRCSVTSEKLSATRIANRLGRRARTFGMTPGPEARMVLLGSSPLRSKPEMMQAALALVGPGPVGVFAAASSEPKLTAAEHVAMLKRVGVEAVDLGISIDTVEYAAHDPDLLESIPALRGILLCGGNQIRLVETLLHRGEESAVLRAMALAHARGTVLVAASGAASALSGVMIAGGSSYEALRYGVSSDTGHRGLVIQEGVGLFGAGIIDQNMIDGNRLGRLVVACAEESERYGIGICEDSAVISSNGGTRLEAAGRHGFVLIEVDAGNLELQSDSFVARGVRLTLLAPGDAADLVTGAVSRARPSVAAADLLERLVRDLAREAGVPRQGARVAASGPRGIGIGFDALEGAVALLDLECPRDDFD
jgi:cyanophycinase